MTPTTFSGSHAAEYSTVVARLVECSTLYNMCDRVNKFDRWFDQSPKPIQVLTVLQVQIVFVRLIGWIGGSNVPRNHFF